MNYDELLQFKKIVDKQNGQNYPCSNQHVVCGVFTQNKEKALNFIKAKGKNKKCLKKMESKNQIYYIFDNGEKWYWRPWNLNCRGFRFYKLAIDKDIDDELFNFIVAPGSYLYCSSVEII